MPTPRQIVRAYLIEKFRTILESNGYGLDVRTVELYKRQTRDINITDLPAIQIREGIDVRRMETEGGNLANQHYFDWNMELMLSIKVPDSAGDTVTTIEDAMEVFLAAVEKCCLANRFNNSNSGKPSDIMIVEREVSSFERIENQRGFARLAVIVRYDYTRSDL